MIASCVGFILLSYPMFYIVLHGASFADRHGGARWLASLLTGLFLGTMPATLVEMFATKSAADGVVHGVQRLNWIVRRVCALHRHQPGWRPRGQPISVAFFVAASAIISLPAVLLLKETAYRAA